MKVNPNYPNGNNKGQRQLWHALKNTFERDDGVSYYRHSIFATSKRGCSEPDFLMIHRRFGIWIFESKGCRIESVDRRGQNRRRWIEPSRLTREKEGLTKNMRVPLRREAFE
ncbi:NERD domain-containing protein [Limnohabitans sp.]|uniref:NERD domain-containing protein n=1 Tax=Limnohabitans sp. TaxID=1907725 RepID=UPI00286FA64E|nr:NERD domain-containing protein [Limnohabitans sp.]